MTRHHIEEFWTQNTEDLIFIEYLSIYHNKNECYVNNKVIEDEIHPDRMIDIVDICIDAEVLFILIILHKMHHTTHTLLQTQGVLIFTF